MDEYVDELTLSDFEACYTVAVSQYVLGNPIVLINLYIVAIRYCG